MLSSNPVSLQSIIVDDIRSIFHQPLDFVSRFEERIPFRDWFRPLSIGLIGYALFGLSAASFQGGSSFLYAASLFPLLFLGALCVGIPVLYIFDSFLGSRLSLRQTMAIGLIAFVMPGVLLAGMAPINWFFAVSMQSPLMVQFSNSLAIGLAAFVGYGEVVDTIGKLDHFSQGDEGHVSRKLFRTIWLFVYLGVLIKFMGIVVPLTQILPY